MYITGKHNIPISEVFTVIRFSIAITQIVFTKTSRMEQICKNGPPKIDNLR